jgi:hypothetical protein
LAEADAKFARGLAEAITGIGLFLSGGKHVDTVPKGVNLGVGSGAK